MINAAQVHLALNHLPILGTLFGLVTYLVARARKSAELRQYALVIFFATALITIPVYLTGEPVEDLVEQLPGVTKAAIERHEDAAGWSFALVGLTGLASLCALVMERLKRLWPRPAEPTLLALAVVGSLAMAYTAHLGGLIRHSELTAQLSRR